MIRPVRFLLLLSLVSLASPAPADDVGIHEVRQWLDTNRRARPYRDGAEELLEVFDDAAQEGLPLWVLFEKLNQGAAKGVPLSRLTAGLESELGRLRIARDLLAPYLPGGHDGDPGELYKQVSLLLAGGLDPRILGALLGPAGGASDGRVADNLRAASAVLAIASTSRLSPEELTTIGQALLGSSLAPKAYGSVASAFARARLAGMDDREAARVVVDVLSAGGGLVRLNQELDERRIR